MQTLPFPLPRVTLKDVARRVNLSVAAVSMALRGNASLAPQTIARVKHAAALMGYVPDPALCALAAYRTSLRNDLHRANLICLSVGPSDGTTPLPASERNLLRGAQKHAQSLGYLMEPMRTGSDTGSARRLDQILQARGVRGILLILARAGLSLPALDWNKYSVVAIGRNPGNNTFDFVESDPLSSLSLCWHELARSGYNCPGLVIDQSQLNERDLRWNAIQGELQHTIFDAVAPVPKLVLQSANYEAQITSWLRRFKPDALVNRSQLLAQSLANGRIHIPDHVGYVSLNVEDEAPGTAGVSPQYEMHGATAVEVLHSHILQNRRGPQGFTVGLTIQGQWISGRTLPARAPTVADCQLALKVAY